MRCQLTRILGTILLLAAAGPAFAGEPGVDGLDLFEKRIRPLLVERCYECHSTQSRKAKGGLLLDSKPAMLKGGDSGPAVVPGNIEKSLLIKAVRYHDPDIQMPPKQPLTEAQIADFERWVRIGAPDPRMAPTAAAAASPAAYDFVKAKQFWSFVPVANPPIPKVKSTDWSANPVDAFVQAQREAKGLRPVEQADRRTLIRRATFDLTGLPPTPAEIEAFLADRSPDAFAKVVDRLLASPAYGERWGRHWLDVVRYADTSGCNADFPIPQMAWYRDYVIASFNTDKPYDQFLKEQIAGDLMPAKDEADRRQKVIATGYLANSRRFGSRGAEFHLTYEDMIDNLGKSMLGLSVSCARCHDHKFDPIPTADYYAIYGILSSTKYAFPGTEIFRHQKDFVPLGPAEQVAILRDYDAKLAACDDDIEKYKNEKLKVSSKLKALKDQKAAGKPVSEEEIASLQDELARATMATAAAVSESKRLEADPPSGDKAYAVSEANRIGDARIQKKGEPKDLGDEVPRGFLTILGGQKLAADDKSSGRLALAGWIADAKNPLTARVMVNRIWQNHFGQGIVKTPNDFGIRGQRPTHPELLDFLATRFVESGWSMKSMHRLIMLSRTYQLASTPDAGDETIDPANDSYWRQNSRRLSAEEIRDSLLAMGEDLDRTPAGPHPFPPAQEWHYTQHKPFVDDYPTNHRSIYLMQQRIRKQPFLAAFDGADTNASTGQRPISTTAIQALFAMNDPLMHEVAEKFAARVMAAGSADDAARIDQAYRLAYGRPPAADEVQLGRDYLRQMTAKLKSAGTPDRELERAAWASYARVILGSNEFVFVD
jgi:hypothetical protein